MARQVTQFIVCLGCLAAFVAGAAPDAAAQTGLVAAYGFEEGAGTTTADASGRGQLGTLSGATWSTAGRFGRALQFDGQNDVMTVLGSAALDLRTGMTIEAWVVPVQSGAFDPVISKDAPGGPAYELIAGESDARAEARIRVAGQSERRLRAASILPLNVWSHLAATYDGATLRLYVNGTLAAQRTVAGTLIPSTGALRIGADFASQQYFAGRIDEVRIYSRALGAAEILADMQTPVVAPDTTLPAVAIGQPLDGAKLSGIVTVTGVASDNVGMAGVRVFVNGQPINAEDTVAPYSSEWDTTTIANGVHTLTAVARDTAGNLATSAPITVAVLNDLAPPSVSLVSPASGTTISGIVQVSATASDDVGVAAVQFLLDGVSLGEDATEPFAASWDTASVPNGSHSLTAIARDASGKSTTSAAVNVTVSNAAAPVAADDAAIVAEDSGANAIDVLLNDTDAEGDTRTITAVTQGANGSVAISGPGVTYTPNANFFGSDSFTYTISDGNGGSDSATVSVTVTNVNDPPSAVDDVGTIQEDASYFFHDALRNDTTAPDTGEILRVTAVTEPLHGSIDMIAGETGAPVYHPTPNFCGTDSFSYTVSDGHDATATANVVIAITCVGEMPQPVDDVFTVPEDSIATALDVLANDIDVDAEDTLRVGHCGILTTRDAMHGTVTVAADRSHVIYTPDPNFAGVASFFCVIEDDVYKGANAPSARVIVNVTPAADAPVAVNDAATTAEDTAVGGNVLANDTADEGATLTARVVSAPSPDQGTMVLNADGSFTFTPALNFAGVSTFTYVAHDGQADSNVGVGTITVTEVNDGPTAVGDAATTAEDAALDIAVLDNDSDSDGDAFALSGVGTPAHGTAAGNANGSVTYTPNANYFGSDSFTYTIQDARGGSASGMVSVTVTSVNDAPTINILAPAAGTIVSGIVAITASASDDTGVTGVQFLLDGVSLGEEDMVPPYEASWDVAGATNGDHVLMAIARDSSGTSTTSAAVNVTVQHGAPVANDDAASVAEDSGANAIAVLANDTDPDGDTRTITAVTQGANGSVAIADSGVTYKPNANFFGSDSFTYTISDGKGGNDSATVSITVTNVNDPPTAVDDFITVAEDTHEVFLYIVDNNDTIAPDVGEIPRIVSVTEPQHGEIDSIGGETGAPGYLVPPNFCGTDSFSYTVSDGNGGTATGKIVITVTCVEDMPQPVDDIFTVPEDSTEVVLDVLANDINVDVEDTLRVGACGIGSPGEDFYGTITVAADRSHIVYTPDRNFTGTALFHCTVEDDVYKGANAPFARITVNVTPVPDAPVAVNDAATTQEDTPVSGQILDNDTDADAKTTLTARLIAGPSADQGTLVLNADGSFTFTPTANFAGVSTFTYLANDGEADSNEGVVTLTVTEVNDAPVVSIIAPVAGSTVSGIVAITASASDDIEVAGVQFLLDGVSLGAEDTTAPYEASWDTAPAASGSHSLTAIARDGSGMTTTSAAVSVTVSNDGAAPAVSITAPTAGSTVSDSINVTASASDDVGVTGVQFLLDGVSLGEEDTTTPYGVTWNTATATAGEHFLSAIARDASGKSTTSAAVSVTVGTTDPNAPSRIGQWAGPFNWPLVTVHMSLMHTGEVLAWDGQDNGGVSATIWNPATNQFSAAPNGFTNLFCASHALLADGRILVAGGHGSSSLGTRDANIYDPVTRQWTALPRMAFARWYPTATTLPDGRVLVVGGAINCFTCIAEVPEIYDPVTNTWTQVTAGRINVPLYPYEIVLPDGRVVNVGANEGITVTRALDLQTQTWSVVDPVARDGGSAVMYRLGKIMKSGSWSRNTDLPSVPTSPTTFVIDMNEPAPRWRQTASMAFPRAHHVLTMLPDGNVLVTGGQEMSDGITVSEAVLEAEIWSPETETWTTVGKMQTPRLYHGNALLLPDGRVLVSGGGRLGGARDFLNAEIYSPPYLFKGARPTISSVPERLDFGAEFHVGTPSGATVTKVVLIRPGSVTHTFNTEQRYLELPFQPNASGLTVTAPANANLAPPGYYMLFLVNGSGVPSVASFVRVPSPAEDLEAPDAPSSLMVTGGTGTATLQWAASLDNTGVALYNVHRFTSPGTLPTVANRVGQTTGTAYFDTGLAAGSYIYVVTAQDVVGNVSAASNEAAVAVAADTDAPTIVITSPTEGEVVLGVVTVDATAFDNVGVAGVQFMLDGVNLGTEDIVAPFSLPWNSMSASNGPHVLTAVARDGAGNTTESAPVSVSVSNTGPLPAGLMAAYNFDEGAGTVLNDRSGNGNPGTVTGAAWTASGHTSGALTFDGVNDWVTVPDSEDLALSNAMTLEAWVYPTVHGDWRTAILKEKPTGLVYSLYSSNDGSRPSGYVNNGGGDMAATGSTLPLNSWSHLALTYDGSFVRLFVNGNQVASTQMSGTVPRSTSPLRFGGNAVWGEFFAGRLDDVRIYNRALGAAEIQVDMATPVP